MTKKKSTNRAAPAYQEYASDMLANRGYRLMSLAEKGLFDLLRRECWVNGSTPSEPDKLALYLGLPINQIQTSMTKTVLEFFAIENGELISPELNAYRQVLQERADRQAEGGSNGGKKTQSKIKAQLEGSLEGSVKVLSRDDMSGVEKIKDELVLKKSLEVELNEVSNKEWLADFE